MDQSWPRKIHNVGMGSSEVKFGKLGEGGRRGGGESNIMQMKERHLT